MKNPPLSLDSVETSLKHREAIRRNPILRDVYLDNYRFISSNLPTGPAGPVLELGSGGGFFREVCADVVRSDLVRLPDIDLILNAEKLPFSEQSLRAVVMQNVLHHILRPENFFAELTRCLNSGGRAVLVEPANTLFAGVMHRLFHVENFDPHQNDWSLSETGRLSAANNALPWIIFVRDRGRFEILYPDLLIRTIELSHPFRYILSGGVSRRPLVPHFLYPGVECLERVLAPWNKYLALFMRVVIERRGPATKN